jgi:hypothetical protein
MAHIPQDNISRNDIVRDLTAAVKRLEQQIKHDPSHAVLLAASDLCAIYEKVTGKEAQI